MNCPNCNIENIPEEAFFCPNCGYKIYPGTVELVCKVPPLGDDIASLLPCDELPIVLGETVLSELKGKRHFDVTEIGYTTWHIESRINASRYELGNETIDKVVIAAKEFPKSWIEKGLDSTMSWNDWCKFLYNNGYDLRAYGMPETIKEKGASYFYARIFAKSKDEKYMITLEFKAPEDRKRFSPNTLCSFTITLGQDFKDIDYYLEHLIPLVVNDKGEICKGTITILNSVEIKENYVYAGEGEYATLKCEVLEGEISEVIINGRTYREFETKSNLWGSLVYYSVSFIPRDSSNQEIVIYGRCNGDIHIYNLPLEIRHRK